MTLIKTSLLNAIAVAIKMLTMLGINKILAIYVGPAGYAAIGNFQNAVQIITTLISGSVNTGVTKYTAEYQGNDVLQQKIWKTAGTIGLISSLFFGLLIIILNKQLSIWFFRSEELRSVFVWFGLTLIFFIFNTFFLAILNGKKEVNRYILINICGSFISLLVACLMVLKFGLYGAILTMTINQSLLFFITIGMCYKTNWFKINYFFGAFDKDVAIKLSKYTVMAITTALTVPVSHILIRNLMGERLGWEVAGYWEAMWRLSSTYLMFVTMTLSVYYLPRLAEINKKEEIRSEILKIYKLIMPITIFAGLIIFSLRRFIVIGLFSENFTPMLDMFPYQIIGDFIKICSWIIGYLLSVKAIVGYFVFSEILFSFLFVFLTYVLIDFFGLEAASLAYCINYIIHWVFIYRVLKSKGVV